MVESGKRMEQLKSYLRRLSEGEILDSVRADFMREFKDVDAVEIMEAETCFNHIDNMPPVMPGA